MEHPVITRTMVEGYPHGEPTYPHCPVCGEEVDTFFRDRYGDIVGCEECLSKVDAWQELEDSKYYD